jgi:Glyoxalase/Bleomycin resistance protein/Dioxygenase superfamily
LQPAKGNIQCWIMYRLASLTSSAVVVSMTRLCARSGLCVSSTSARIAAPITVMHRARSGSSLQSPGKPRSKPQFLAHLCFRAPGRKAVDAFYAAALAAGGRDDGSPGLRPQYHADYYCAFVLDPDGHRIEAVCHAPESPIVQSAG